MRIPVGWRIRPVDEAEEQRYHAVAVPRELFTAEPGDRAALQEAVARVHPRWRLDVVLAMEDIVAGMDDADVALEE